MVHEDVSIEYLMGRVWAMPDLPVKLTAPNSGYPWGFPVSWPRERIDAPQGRPASFLHLCPCRSGNVRAIVDEDDFPMPLRSPIVELTGRRLALSGAEDQPARTAMVYLGQCQDCGRIYWSVAR